MITGDSRPLLSKYSKFGIFIMKENAKNVNSAPVGAVAGGIAQVTNVAVLNDAIKRTADRHHNLPGI